MIELTANKPFPYAGRRVKAGERFKAPRMDARTLVYAGLASQVLDQTQPPPPAANIQTLSPVAPQRARRGSSTKPRASAGTRKPRANASREG